MMSQRKCELLLDYYEKVLQSPRCNLECRNLVAQRHTGKLWDPDAIVASGINARFRDNHILHVIRTAREFIVAGRREKFMRWLGFMQGYFWMRGIFSVEQLGVHNMPYSKTFNQFIRKVQAGLAPVEHMREVELLGSTSKGIVQQLSFHEFGEEEWEFYGAEGQEDAEEASAKS